MSVCHPFNILKALYLQILIFHGFSALVLYNFQEIKILETRVSCYSPEMTLNIFGVSSEKPTLQVLAFNLNIFTLFYVENYM